MKNKWLIGLLTGALAVTMCFGIAACGDEQETPGGTTQKTDSEIAKEAINTIKVMYASDAAETAKDFQVLGQTKVDDTLYNVVWTATATTAGVNISDYVTIGTMDATSKLVTIGITRGEVEVEYNLKASVTVGEATESAEFAHKIPAAAIVSGGDVKFDFSGVEYKIPEGQSYATAISAARAKEVLLAAGGADCGLTSVDEAVQVYEGNGSGGGLEERGGFLKMGSGSVNGKLTLTFTKPVNKVAIVAQAWKDTNESGEKIDKITVNGSAEQTPTVDATSAHTFEIDASNTVTIETIKRIYIFEITIFYAPEGSHVHNLGTPTHVNGEWIHRATCTAPDCPVDHVDTPCEPVFNECPVCGYTYTAAEILARVPTGESMKGTYSLTGTVTSEPKHSTFAGSEANIMFYMSVNGISVQAYYVTPGTGVGEVKKGDTVTVQGPLTYFNDRQIEFNGGTIVECVPGVDERTPQQKVDAALQALNATFTVTKTGETDLPASTVDGVTFTWATGNQTYTITNNKINVKALPAADETVSATVTATYGAENVTNNTKQVTITIKAESSTPGKGDGTVDHPYSVAEAQAIIAALGSETVYKVNGEIALVYVKGIVTVKGTTDNYGIKNYYMADVAGDTANDICVYSLNWGTVKKGTEIGVGDTIIVTGYLQNFNGTYEVSSYKDSTWHNGTVEAHTPAGGSVEPTPQLPEPVKGTEIDAAGATVFDFSDVAVAEANDYSEIADDVLLAAFDNFEGLTVTKSKVYAGNNTTSGPSDEYKSTGGFLRMGSSKANGTLTLTFTKNVTKIQILCIGWSDSDTIAIDGFNPATIGNTAKVAYTYTLTEAVKSFTVTTGNRALVFMIAVTFADGSDPEPQPQPTGSLELNWESFSILDDSQTSGYDKYKGTQTVNGYQVTISDVMPGSEGDYKAVQFKKNSGTLKVTGTFKKITVVLVSTNEYGDDYILTITAGTTKLIPSLIKTEETGKKDGQLDIKIYTIEYAVTTTGPQEFTLKAGTKANYASSIVFDDGTGSDPEIEKGTETNPYTAAEALAEAKKIVNETGKGVYSENMVYVKGIVCLIDKYTDANGWTFYIGAAKNTAKEDALQVYQLAVKNCGDFLALSGDLAVGDEVVLYGYLQNYQNKNYEICGQSKMGDLVLKEYVDSRDADKKAEDALATAKAALEKMKAVDAATTLIALPVSTISGVTLTYEGVGVTDNKLAFTHTDTETEVTVTIKAGAKSESVVFTVAAETATPQAKYDASQQGFGNSETLVTATAKQVTFTFNSNDGTAPAYYTGDSTARLYNKNTLVISVPSGYKISKITFKFVSNGDKEITVDAGTLTPNTTWDKKPTSAEWNGSAESVTFTFTGTQRILEIVVEYGSAAATAAVAPVAILPGKEF